MRTGEAVVTRGTGSGVSAGERECKRLALARDLVSGRLRVGVRIILGALLVRIAAATIGVGQAAREVLMSLSSDLTGPFFVLRFCGLVGLVRQWQRRIVLLNIFRPGSGATVWSITGDGVGSGLPFCEFHHMLRYTNPDHLSGDRARLARTIESRLRMAAVHT